MNINKLVSLLALLILIIVLPAYAWLEPARMEQTQADLRQEYVSDAAVIYVENCTICHGAEGEGIGAMPGLDNDGLRTADYDILYKTIARGRYDTAMTDGDSTSAPRGSIATTTHGTGGGADLFVSDGSNWQSISID